MSLIFTGDFSHLSIPPCDDSYCACLPCSGSGDITGAVKQAQQALGLTPEQDDIRHIQAISLLGIAQYANGDLDAADRSLTDFLVYLRKDAYP